MLAFVCSFVCFVRLLCLLVFQFVSFCFGLLRFACFVRVVYLCLFGLACLAWRCLPLLALLVVLGVVQRCLFFAWCYLALFGFAGVACLAWHCLTLLGTAWHCLALFRFASRCLPCLALPTICAGRSCTFLFANALSVLCLPGGWGGTVFDWVRWLG